MSLQGQPEPAVGGDAAEARRAYSRALRLLGELVDGPPPVDELLEQLLAIALTAAPRLAAATVTARADDGRLMNAATTDAAAKAVDQLEYDLHEGPCVAAMETGQEQFVGDVNTDSRWPRFNARAAELGFGCVGGLPLVSADETIGALNVFGRRPGDLDEATLQTLRRLIPPLSAALARGRAHRRYQRLLDEMADQRTDAPTETVARRLTVHGRVQGVFFRAVTQERAQEHGVSGWVANRPDGTVELWLEGAADAVAAVERWVRDGGPPRAQVARVHGEDASPDGHDRFDVQA